MSQLALARRYRPQTFQAVIGQEATLRALKAALDTKHLHHAYLFTGTRGVGKTTLARILAKCLNCEQGISSTPCGQCFACQAIQAGSFVDVVEVDAASRTKVEDTRELLDNVQYLPTSGRFKIYLIDEVHMLSGHSFNALLKTLEEPPEHVKFLLATTDPQKLPVTVLSRCLQFHLRCLPVTQIAAHLQTILAEEKIAFEPEALAIIGRSAQGSMRDALSLLDQAIAYRYGATSSQAGILANDVRKLLGLTEKGQLLNLLEAIVNADAQTALQGVAAIAEFAPDFTTVLVEFLTLIHQIAIAQQVPEALEEDILEREAILEVAKKLSLEEVQLYYQIGLLGQRDLPYAPTPQLGFEMTILRMLAFQPVQVLDSDSSFRDTTRNIARTQKIKWVEEARTVEKAVERREELIAPENWVQIQTTRNDLTEHSNLIDSEDLKPEAAVIEPFQVQSPQWLEIIPGLNLSGMARELACHCSIIEWTDQNIHLLLEASRKPLLNKRYEERLQAALCQYLNKHIHLKITLGDSKAQASQTQTSSVFSNDLPSSRSSASPNLSSSLSSSSFSSSEKRQDLIQQKAQELIKADPNFGRLIDQFDAEIEQITLVEES